MNRILASLVFCAALAASALPAAAGEDEVLADVDNLLGDAAGFVDAYWLLRDAMTYGDPVTVAALADYPLRIEANGEAYDVLAPQDLIENYDLLLTPATQALVSNQELGELMVNSDGVMFGDGELWMAPLCENDACTAASWRIIAINN